MLLMTTLIDDLLAEQQALTAAERFSEWHDRAHDAPRYTHLMPATPPGPGEQYAFEVNLDACTGCKACVAACHSLNGLDDDEAWRDVGMLIGKDYQQTVTTACHHCADPACMNGCPVGAYEKQADTGVVKHLDDQCIGCGYCVLKCPYEVPKYSEKLGIVRKCDMCVGRLREGEAPACVQACPTSAISIRVVKSETLTFAAGTEMLPGAFDSSYTKPSTTYVTQKTLPKNTHAADATALRLEHAHWPLILMLTLTQLSAGMFIVGAVVGMSAIALYLATGALMVGLGVSVLHLGRPMGAWRFFLGLRTSWMSREILAFSVLAMVASVLVVREAFWSAVAEPQRGADTALVSSTISRNHKAEGLSVTVGAMMSKSVASAKAVSPPLQGFATALQDASRGSLAILAIIAVFTSAMIYIDTRRPFWNAALTHGKFFGGTLAMGLAAMGLFHPKLMVLAIIARAAVYAWEQTQNRRAFDDEDCAWHLSARVMKLKLAHVMNLGEAVVPLMLAFGTVAAAFDSMVCTVIVVALSVLAVIIERYTFFVASMGLKMPGGFKT